MKNKKYFILGVVFLAGLVILYWGINFLKGLDIFSKNRTYYIEYNNVSGLLPANPVNLNGYKIGQVSDIRFKDDNSGKIIVEIVIYEDVKIPENSIARIESADLLGNRAIVIYLGNSNNYLKNKSYIKGEVQMSFKEEVSIEMQPLKRKIESLLSSFDSALVVIQAVFNEDTRENINRTIESIRTTISNFERTSVKIDSLMTNQQGRIGNIIRNIESISSNIKNHNDEIKNIIENLSQLSDTLLVSNIKQTIQNTEKVLKDINQITQDINAGKGSIGKLLKSDSLYKNLESSSRELDLLLEDMRLNPHRYLQFNVFGKRPKEVKSRKQ